MYHVVKTSSEMKNPTVFAHFSVIATKAAGCLGRNVLYFIVLDTQCMSFFSTIHPNSFAL